MEYLLPFKKKTLDDLIRTDVISAVVREKRHKGIDALKRSSEFYLEVPDGTPITACRGGIATNLGYNSKYKKLDDESAHLTNFIQIYHDDGTFAVYTHVFPSIICGSTIKTNQEIGVLGGGLSYYLPHLHLDFYRERKIAWIISAIKPESVILSANY